MLGLDLIAQPNRALKIENAARILAWGMEGGKFTDPVWTDLITGRVYEIPQACQTLAGGKMVLRQIPTYDAPVVIADRKVVLR